MGRQAVRRRKVDEVNKEVWEADGLPRGLIIQVLNVGDEKAPGARTLIVDFPEGWQYVQAHWHTCDEEFLVLDGELEVGGRTYRKGHYVFRPAGMEHGATRSPKGCRLLYWHESDFDVRTDAPPSHSSIEKPFIDGLDTAVPLEEWDIFPVHFHEMPKELRMIKLRNFEETGCDNTLEWLPPDFYTPFRHFHTADEEAFFVEGGWGATDPTHVHTPGYYFNLKAGAVHGPAEAWDIKIVVKHYGKHESILHVPLDLDLTVVGD